MIQVPTAVLPIVIAVNTTGLNIWRATPVGGTSGLYLSRRALCGIFTGIITNWNDPILTYDNHNTQLHASLPIRVVRRSDSSGTTFLFTRHLNQVCSNWYYVQADGNNHPYRPGNLADWNLGAGTTVAWPASFLSASGDAGIASTIVSTPGAIGYVSPDYTRQVARPEISPAPVAANLQNHTNWAALVGDTTPTTAEHMPTAPSVANPEAVLTGLRLPSVKIAAAWSAALDTAALRNPTYRPPAYPNPALATAYPIVGFTMLDLYSCYFPAAETSTLKGLISWYTGHHPRVSTAVPDQIARKHGFVSLNQTFKDAVWAWANDATLGLKTGPISGTCTVSSGT